MNKLREAETDRLNPLSGLEGFKQNIEQWKLIDTAKNIQVARSDETGFWRLPRTPPAERELGFETDKAELERLGKLKTAMGFWPNEAVVHFYSPIALILGKLDRRLPAEERALTWLEEEEVPTVLRIAGGQAIVSDHGILNISLLFAQPDDSFSIDDGFRLIADVIREAWTLYLKQQPGMWESGLELTIGEVKDSYCPGDYDLSLGGKKVAGIAQRRVRNAIGLMAYISVEGDQTARCRLVRDFYDAGEADERFPASDPAVMTTLAEATNHLTSSVTESITISKMKECILSVLGAQKRSPHG